MQVNSLATATNLLQQAELIVAEEFCLNLRGRHELCALCLEQCHSEALQLTVDAVAVNTEACSRCGGCIPACPAGVFRLSSFSPRKLLSTVASLQQNDTLIHLHCSHSSPVSKDSQGGIIIPCFKLLDARLLAAVQAGGVNKVFLHGTGGCEGCENGDARKFLGEQRWVLQQWFAERAILFEEAADRAGSAGLQQYHQDKPELSRRNFLRLVSSGTATGISSWFFPVPDEVQSNEEAMPFYQSDGLAQEPVLYQQVLAERLDKLPWRADSVLPWRTRTISEDCSGCLSCAERCPTGALQSVRMNGEQTVNFAATLCTDCQLCTRLCPESAINPMGSTSVLQVQQVRSTLISHKITKCSYCASAFISEQPPQTVCPICRNEHDLDAEWMAMLDA